MKTDVPIKSDALPESYNDGLIPRYDLYDPGTFKPCTYGNTLSEMTKGSSFALPFAAIRAAVKYYLISQVEWIKKGEMKGVLPYSTLQQLETLRREFNRDHESFLAGLSCSSALGSKMIQRDYFEHKTLFPQYEEQEILSVLLTENLMMNPYLLESAAETDMSLIEKATGDAMKKIASLDQLCLYFEALKRKSRPDYYESDLGKTIEKTIWEGHRSNMTR